MTIVTGSRNCLGCKRTFSPQVVTLGRHLHSQMSLATARRLANFFRQHIRNSPARRQLNNIDTTLYFGFGHINNTRLSSSCSHIAQRSPVRMSEITHQTIQGTTNPSLPLHPCPTMSLISSLLTTPSLSFSLRHVANQCLRWMVPRDLEHVAR